MLIECRHKPQSHHPVHWFPADGLVQFYKAMLSNLVTPSTLHILLKRSWIRTICFNIFSLCMNASVKMLIGGCELADNIKFVLFCFSSLFILPCVFCEYMQPTTHAHTHNLIGQQLPEYGFTAQYDTMSINTIIIFL